MDTKDTQTAPNDVSDHRRRAGRNIPLQRGFNPLFGAVVAFRRAGEA